MIHLLYLPDRSVSEVLLPLLLPRQRSEWNEELNSILNDRLPSGGYFIKATGKQARQLEEKTGGIPVYMKLIAHEGRLYPYRT